MVERSRDLPGIPIVVSRYQRRWMGRRQRHHLAPRLPQVSSIDIVWTSPIYKSPQADMGYDIADYKDIDPAYGSLADVDELISELGKRDMKLMMDLVVNHTSNQHP